MSLTFTSIIRLTSAFILLHASTLVLANNAMDAAQLQQLMQNGEAIEACFNNIDESKLEAMGVKGQKLQKEVEQLCDQGKAQQATQKAIQYSREVRNDELFMQVKKCSKLMGGMAMNLYLPVDGEENEKTANVCQ